ncbi:MAG: ribulose-phosphate 3-epimerase [Christensenellaceae bacterium]
MMIKIAPSLLSADFVNMERDVKMLEKAGADYMHCDIMDGIFVPNITFGFQMIASLKRITTVPLDVHLMIEKPERYIERFAESGSDIISIHVESTVHIQRVLKQIAGCGKIPAVVLNPATSLETIKYVLEDVEMVLLMSVNPGYGGQSFIPAILQKTADLKKMIHATGKQIEIEIDGGINFENCKTIIDAGADVLVAGNTVFSADNPALAVQKLRG